MCSLVILAYKPRGITPPHRAEWEGAGIDRQKLQNIKRPSQQRAHLIISLSTDTFISDLHIVRCCLLDPASFLIFPF
jgi:hypothetical protein